MKCFQTLPGSPFCLLVATGLIMACSTPAGAWSEAGHKVVALIAWQRLSVKEHEWVAGALRRHPLREQTFEAPLNSEPEVARNSELAQQWLWCQAAVWPDLVRPALGIKPADNPLGVYHHGSWHYTDLPVFPSEAVRAKLVKHDHEPGMEWSPESRAPLRGWNSVQVLKKALHELMVGDTPPDERAVMLCWVFHLMGDMHQPCHCVSLFAPGHLSGGDRGANGLTLQGMGGIPLHAFWDGLLNADGHGASLLYCQGVAKDLLGRHELVKKAEQFLRVDQPEDWLREGRQVAVEHVYTMAVLAALKEARVVAYEHDGRELSLLTLLVSEAELAKYESQAKAVAEQQVVIAGFRLARIIRMLAKG